MNLPRIYLIAILLLAIGVGANSQELPQAILFDEYDGKTNCELLMSRLDILYAEISKKPAVIAYALIRGSRRDIRKNLIHENMISNYSRFRGIGTERVKTVRGELRSDFNVQLWIVPEGAEKPFSEVIWTNQLSRSEKPFLFYWEYPVDYTCLPWNGRKVFADILRANPISRGNIVIRAKSRHTREKLTSEIHSQLAEYQVARHRIRIFNIERDPKNTGATEPETEFWLLP